MIPRELIDQAREEHRACQPNADASTIAIGARMLVREVWRLVDRGVIDARSLAADVALDLRDAIDPAWSPLAEAAEVEQRCTCPPAAGCQEVER